jgi:hypothetical protein
MESSSNTLTNSVYAFMLCPAVVVLDWRKKVTK